MRKHRLAIDALRQVLAHRIGHACGDPVPLTVLNALAKRQGFTAADVRLVLHKMAQAGFIEFTTNPVAFEVQVVEVAE